MQPVTLHGTTAIRFTAADPDVRLMLEVRDDNAAAFEELVLRYQDRLVNVLESIVRNHQWAEDLAQEVFLRVFRSRKTYVPGAKFSTWLYTIANNVASNALRNRSRRKEVNVASTGASESAAVPLAEMALAKSSFMPARRLDKMEMSEVVRSALDSLSDRQRMALVLCKFEGLCYQDIAEAMGLTVKAVKSLLSRARVNLRTALEPYIEAGLRPTPEVASGEKETPLETLNVTAKLPATPKPEKKLPVAKVLTEKPLPVAKSMPVKGTSDKKSNSQPPSKDSKLDS